MADNLASRVRCHVVAVTPDLTSVLAIRTAAGWLLPCVESNVLPGVLPAVETMLGSLASSSTIVHAAPLTWGVPPPRDAYCVVLVSGATRSDVVEPVLSSALQSMLSLLPVQQQALATSLRRLREPRAPFDSAADVDAALRWAEQQMAELAGARLISTSRHRSGRHEYVVRLETTAGLMFFKAGRDRVTDEAALTDLLQRLRPRQFPTTLAIDRVRHWWLYRALDGELLIGQGLTTETASAAARALACLQKDVLRDSDVQGHLYGRRVNAVQIFRSVDQFVRQAWASSMDAGEYAPGYGRWCAAADRMFDTCAKLDDLGLPMSLVLSDFWSRNIVATSDGCGFIDVGQSYWSYPALSLWRFVNDMEEQLDLRGAGRGVVERAFTAEWADMIAPDNMGAFLASLPFLGHLFNILLISQEWDLQERALEAPPPSVYRARHLSPHVRRILRAFRSITG